MATLKMLLIAFGLVFVNYVNNLNVFPLFALTLSIYGIIKFWTSFPFISDTINRIFLFLNVFTFISSSIVLIYVNTSMKISIFFQIFTITVLAYKLSIKAYNYKIDYINSIFTKPPDQIDWSTDVPPYAIDYFVRKLSKLCLVDKNKYQLSQQQLNELVKDEMLSRHLKTCTKKPFCFCEGIESGIDKEAHIQLIEKQEKRRAIVKQEILQIFDNYLKNQKDLNFVHTSYLYYLHGKLQNYLLVNTQIFEYINEKKSNLNVYDRAHLEYQLFLNMNSSKLNSNLQIDKVFKYDEKINVVKILLVQCMTQKLEILRQITDDVIDLIQLENKIIKFMKDRKMLEATIIEVLDANSFCPLLQNMINVFSFNISFAENKDKFFENKKLTKLQKKLNEKLFQKNSTVIFISLMNSSFGIMKQVSKNFENVFDLPQKNAIGSNCNILMPPGISQAHNNALKRYIQNGSQGKTNILQQQPMLAQSKQGFVFQIKKQFQIYTTEKNDLGLIGQVIKQESFRKEDFLIINLQQLPFRIESYSKNIFQKIFTKNHVPNKESQMICLSRLFPMLSYIVQNGNNKKNSLKQVNDQYQDSNEERGFMQTIGFFPVHGLMSSSNNPKQSFIGGGNLHTLMQDGEFSLLKNKAYIIKFKLWYIKNEYLDQCTIHIEQLKFLHPDIIIGSNYETLILDQLKRFCSLSYTANQLRTCLCLIESEINFDAIDNSYEKQYFPRYSIDQTAVDAYRNIKHKEILAHDKVKTNNDQVKGDQKKVKSHFFQNEVDFLQVDQQNVFSLATIQSPRKDSEQASLIQKSPRSKEKDHHLIPFIRQAILNEIQNQESESHENQIQNFDKNNKNMNDDNDIPSQSMKKTVMSSEILSFNKATTIRKSQFHAAQSVSTSINSQFKVQKQSVVNSVHSNKIPFLINAVKNFSLVCLCKQFQINLYFLKIPRNISIKQFINSFYENMLLQIIIFIQNNINFLPNFKIVFCNFSRFFQTLEKFKVIFHYFIKHLSDIYNIQKLFLFQIFLIYSNILNQFILKVTLIVLIYVVFQDLKQLFDESQNNFYYISLGNNLRVTMSMVNKGVFISKLLELPIYGYQNDPMKKQYQQELKNLTNLSLQQYQSMMKEVMFEKMVDLNFLNILYDHEIDSYFAYSETRLVNITTASIYALLISQANMFQMVSMVEYSARTEINFFSNFIVIADVVTILQTTQAESVLESFDLIKKKVFQSLLIITIVCAGFFIMVFPVYNFSQNYKQKIYTLFTTVDTLLIKEMHQNILFGFSMLSEKNAFQLQSVKKYENLQLFTKKKSISSGTLLPKFSLNLLFVSIFLYIILIIYPIVNSIITNDLIELSNNNQALQSALQTTKATYMSLVGMYGLYTHSTMFENVNPFQESYKARFDVVVDQAGAALNNLISKRYNQDEFESFIVKILKDNACDPIIDHPKYMEQFTKFDIQICNTIIDDTLQHGLTATLRYLLQMIIDIQHIQFQSDIVQRDIQLKSYFQKYKLLDIATLTSYIKEIIEVMNNFVFNNNADFFEYMYKIQTLLMIYQFFVLIVVNQFALMIFFKSITNNMIHARQTLSIFEVKYLLENPYIMSFLNRS